MLWAGQYHDPGCKKGVRWEQQTNAIDEDDCYDYDDNDNDDDGDDDDDDDDDDDETTTATTMVMMTTTRTICSLHVYEVCPSDSDSWAESAGRIQPMLPFR